MKKIIGMAMLVLTGVVLGLGAGFYISPDSDDAPGVMPSAAQREPLYWVAPMDANYRRDEPGLSPMGMELIPVYEEQQGGDTVQVPSAIQQNLGLRTARVQRTDLAREVDSVAYTRWDESTIQMLYPRAEGWLEVFNLASVGDVVSRGQVIYELFAPTLVSAQREYLTARQSDNQALAAVSRDRLKSLGFSETQIDALDDRGETSNRLVYRAERDAIVTAIGVREGNYVAPASHIATLASLDRIWLDAEIFESDAGALAPGLDAVVTFPAFPGELWESLVAYVYPELDPDNRSLRVRLVMENADHRLKANMFANVRVMVEPKRNALVVPREAVIRSGAGARVIVALAEGRFQPRAVTAGISSGGMTEILAGLEDGEVVVSSGQFLLDGEANGEQAMARLMGAQGDEDTDMATDEDMPGMNAGAAEGESAGDGAAAVYTTTGTITRKSADGMLTISHAPVSELNWPAMTMGFEVAPEVPLENFNVDDVVTFEFEPGEGGMYRVIRLERQAR
jgi:Cu(I)/Ag(I) efflux system membrane fusion protein